MKLKALPLFAMLFLAGCLPSADFKVSVKVIDESTGKPIPDAWVFVTAYVQAEPPFEERYNEPLAGARAQTDSQGVARLKNLEGLSYRGEPQNVLYRAIIGSREARYGKPKRRIVAVEGGSVVVLAKGYGLLSAPFGVKGNARYEARLKKEGGYHGIIRLGHYGEQAGTVEIDPIDLAKGTAVTLKMKKPDDLRGLMTSYCPGMLTMLSWAATSEKTGTTSREKKAIYDYIIQGMAADLDVNAYEGCGGGTPSDWAKPEVRDEFMTHELGQNAGQDPVLRLWMTEKALEILPPGYDEIKHYAEAIKGGVVAEGADRRGVNHFYNPFDSEGKTPGEQALKWAEIGYPKNPHNDWGWEDALAYYRAGDKGKAYKALGHVLRVLEDLSMPMNTHGIVYDEMADSKESHFAVYFSTLAQENNISLPPRFSSEARVPTRMPDVKTLFDTQAKLAFGKFRQGNLEVNFDDYYGLGSVTKQTENAVLEAMGEYLFPKAIAHAAGFMKMFYQGLHVEAYAQKPVENQSSATDASDKFGMSSSTQEKVRKETIRLEHDEIWFLDKAGNLTKKLKVSPIIGMMTEENRTKKYHPQLEREATIYSEISRHAAISSDNKYVLLSEEVAESYLLDAPQLQSHPLNERFLLLTSSSSLHYMDQSGRVLWTKDLKPYFHSFSLRISNAGEYASSVIGRNAGGTGPSEELLIFDRQGNTIISFPIKGNPCRLDASSHDISPDGNFALVDCSLPASLPATVLIDVPGRRQWRAPFAFHVLKFLDQHKMRITYVDVALKGHELTKAGIKDEILDADKVQWEPL